jgi:hypothetical protein
MLLLYGCCWRLCLPTFSDATRHKPVWRCVDAGVFLQARVLELSEEEVKARGTAAREEHMAANDLLTQMHTLGGDAQSR